MSYTTPAPIAQYRNTHIYTKVLVRCSSGFGPFARFGVFLHLLHLRKHCYLPHGSHFGTQNGRSGLPGCCWSTRKGRSGLLRRRQLARKGRSCLLRRRQCARNCRFGLPRWRQCARKGCSGLLQRCQCAQNSHSGLLWRRQCAQKACSSPLQCTECAQRGCSSLLCEITIRKCWSRLHSALSHCTLLHFAPCMDMRDAVRACCPRSLFESAGLGFTLL